MLHGKHFQSDEKTSRERLRSGVPKAAFRSLRRSRRSSVVRWRARPYRSVCGSGLIALSLRRYVCGFACYCASSLWFCVLLRCLLLFATPIDRYRCYGVMLMALSVYVCVLRVVMFCAVEVDCRCGVMFLLLRFPAAKGFRFFELLKCSTAFLRR